MKFDDMQSGVKFTLYDIPYSVDFVGDDLTIYYATTLAGNSVALDKATHDSLVASGDLAPLVGR